MAPAELHQRVAGEGAELVGAAQPARKPAQQQRLVEPPWALQARLDGKIVDVRRDETGREFSGALDHDGVAVHVEAARSGCDDRSTAAGRIALARNHDGAP